MAFQIRLGVLFALGLVSVALAAGSGAAAAPGKPEDTDSQEALRAYLHLQEQLHATQLAIDQARRESRDSAAENAKALTDRLKPFAEHLREIEAGLVALNTQQVQELRSLRASNESLNESLRERVDHASRSTIEMTGALGVIGLLVLLAMAFFQWRTVNGLTTISSAVMEARRAGLNPAPGNVPGPADAVAVSREPPDGGLLNALDQLEKRIDEMERAVNAASTPSGSSQPIPASNGKGQTAAPEGGVDPENAARAHRIAALFGRGQSLLSLGNPEAAIGCFDELLGLDPGHAEALVKKGAALERLQRLDEAMSCFDRAIASDSSLTVAYLHKGGLFNRMERHSEALQCYEQALHTQNLRAA
jgi:tetratricopeptide (TPR) repeat protein